MSKHIHSYQNYMSCVVKKYHWEYSQKSKKNKDEHEFAGNFLISVILQAAMIFAHNRFAFFHSNHSQDENAASKATGQKAHTQCYTVLSFMPI